MLCQRHPTQMTSLPHLVVQVLTCQQWGLQNVYVHSGVPELLVPQDEVQRLPLLVEATDQVLHLMVAYVPGSDVTDLPTHHCHLTHCWQFLTWFLRTDFHWLLV